jgi:uncharacterized protein (DUF362 family)
MTVSLVTFDGSVDCVRIAVELCDGFGKLRASDKVLIKPNNCFRHEITPPFGMVTTSWMIDAIVQLLLEHGCKDVSVGEGAIIGIFDELAPLTRSGFKGSGIDTVAKKRGVKLIDFNRGPYQEVDLAGTKVQVSTAPLETDFLINVPVLKTHFQTRVSLGFKNLKGCLSQDSKKRFHKSRRLESLVSHLNEAIRTDLVIVDGIYMMEKGPETLAGVAHRKDLIIAGTDPFECDVVGATVLGADPSAVEYLREYGERHDRSFDLGRIEIRGEDIGPLREQPEWQFQPDEELLGPSGITGLSAPPPGQTLCSACGATLALTLSIMGKDNRNRDFDGAELYYGLDLTPSRDTRKVFLYGDCAISRNRGMENATRISGCPPTLTRTIFTLANALLSKPGMAKMMFQRALKMSGIRLGIYHELFPRWDKYRSKEFDRSHFWLED